MLNSTSSLPDQVMNNLSIGVWGNASVYFKDGTEVKAVRLKEVVEKKLDGEILILNEGTRLFEYKKIKGWFKAGTVKDKTDLINIQAENLGKRHGDNNGFILTLTPTYKVLTKRGWVETEVLRPEDCLITSYLSIQGEMRGFLYAMTPGDSHILANSNNSKNTAALTLQDSEVPEYVKWKEEKLSPWIKFHISSLGYVSEYTHDLKLIKNEISAFTQGRNPIPFLDQHFTILGLAVWIMDDGNFSDGSYTISIARFADFKPVLRVASLLLRKFGYDNKIYDQGGLRFNRKVSRKIAEDICRFVPNCMNHKLPEDLKNKYEEFNLDYNLELLPEYVKFRSKRNASDRQMNKIRSIYDLAVEGSNNYLVGNHDHGIVVRTSN